MKLREPRPFLSSKKTINSHTKTKEVAVAIKEEDTVNPHMAAEIMAPVMTSDMDLLNSSSKDMVVETNLMAEATVVAREDRSKMMPKPYLWEI